MSAANLVPLEDMKKIINESLTDSNTYVEFYTEIINGVYKFGIERGKVEAKSDTEQEIKVLKETIVSLKNRIRELESAINDWNEEIKRDHQF